MIPQERELEGLSVIPIFLLPILSKGGDQLSELLWEGQEVLFFPMRLLKTTSSLMGGVGIMTCSLFSPSLTHYSLMHSHAPPLTCPLIHHHLCLVLAKETELLKNLATR
jgi:hypothetical protein